MASNGPLASAAARAESVGRMVLTRGGRRAIVDRVVARLSGDNAALARGAVAWSERQEVDLATWARTIDADAWNAAAAASASVEEEARVRLQRLGVDVPPGLAGGAATALLSFVVATTRPRTVVETGVALGFSSATILRALEQVGHGRLWSSDLPYYAIPDAERLIGSAVEDRLRHRWTLLTDGDRRNLPRIMAEVGDIDVFHYDSEKYRRSRERAFALVQPRLARRAVVVFDDIHNNDHFRALVEQTGWEHAVFGVEGARFKKYVGVLLPSGYPV